MNPFDDTEDPRHPDAEALAAFACGTIARAERDAVEAHLADCADCRATACLASSVDLLAQESGTAHAVPAGLSDRILARTTGAAPAPVPAREPEGTMGRSLRRAWTPFAAAATALAAVTAVISSSLLASGRGSGPDWPEYLPAALPARAGAATPPPRPADLGGPDRYLAHLQTDKPMYRPGERLFARAVLLNAFDRRPHGANIPAFFEVRSAVGEVVARAAAQVENGAAGFGWVVPDGVAGGQYTLAASFPWTDWADADTTFDVRDYRVPRINTDLQFAKKAYGAGETVTATVAATRAEGGVPAGATVAAVATVDGVEAFRKDGLALDAEGRLFVTFPLPREVAVGDGTLALTLTDGGVVETAAKTIPIVVNRVALSFYPEGGDLVAGLPARVYFEARTPKKAPADVSGAIVDGDGREVARFSSTHEGRGVAAFVPSAFTTYAARVERPVGITEAFPLSAVRAEGLSLTARQPAFGAAEPVRVGIASPVDAYATLGLYVKEREVALETVRLRAGMPAEVRLHPREAASGVLRVTAFDAAGTPRAERLVLRKPPSSLNVALAVTPQGTDPGGRVTVDVTTTDPQGRPVSAVVGVGATDDSVLETVDPRERAPRLPVQALLGADVRELRDAHLYLGDEPAAARRTDLLLATQGWRRFAFVDPLAFAAKEGAAGWRAVGGRNLPQTVTYAALGAGGGAGAPLGAAPLLKPTEPAQRLEFDGDVPIEENMRVLIVENEVGKRRAAEKGLALLFPRGATRGGRWKVNIKEPRAGLPAACGAGKCGGDDFAQGFFLDARTIRFDVAGMAWARVYAHEAPKGRPADQRTDFTETVYWATGLKTDAAGKASFAFDASDAVTTIRIRADGYGADGALGVADARVEVRRALYVEPKFPLEVTAGDRIDLPVAVVNGTGSSVRAALSAEVGDGLRLLDGAAREVLVPARGSARVVLALEGRPHAGTVKVRLRAAAGTASDDVTREVRVVPAGFPIAKDMGGVLEKRVEHGVEIPEETAPGSVSVTASVYPSPLATMTKALEALLREPGGCFEQTSSSNYPNVMVLQYLRSHQGADPAIGQRAAELLARGYQKLTAFECKQKGYEWFGGDPGHEALTAYGVLEFTDMAQVMDVDPAMVERTRAWLLARRDGKGGFLRNERALDSFGRAPKDVTDAYVTWALVEAGEKGVAAEAAALVTAGTTSDDPYVIALAALVAAKTGDGAGKASLLARLSGKQGKDGAVEGARTSITGSGGDALKIEATSLAILAWLSAPEHAAEVERAMTWLATRCQDGRFGSTQATILALRAIIAYDAARARPKQGGKVRLLVDGEAVETLAFEANHEGALVLPDVGARLKAGAHRLALELEGGGAMPYSLSVRYHAMTPASAPETKVDVTTEITRAEAREGDPVDVAVVVRNRAAEGVPMVVAIVGLPGGLEARTDALKELVREGKADAYETRGREVIFYWRGLAPGAAKSLVVPCVAAVPGRYVGPASRAYLYYTDEHKAWTRGLSISVTRQSVP